MSKITITKKPDIIYLVEYDWWYDQRFEGHASYTCLTEKTFNKVLASFKGDPDYHNIRTFEFRPTETTGKKYGTN